MPLVSSLLSQQIEPFFDRESATFSAYPEDVATMADNWSAAVQAYVSGIIPPSTTIAPSIESFKSLMLTINPQAQNALIVLPQAFAAQAATMAGGMAGAGFTGVPPAAPLNLQPAWNIGTAGGSAAQVLAAMVPLIDAWYRTGIAILIAPPNTPMPWS